MATSLLTTKLNIPPARPGLVSRPRLLEKLQTCLNYNLTLVSAPTGFGKTTLLTEWIHHSQPAIRAAWLSLEKEENDPVRFWDYFLVAVQKIESKAGENARALLHSPQPLPIESALSSLINELATITCE